MVFKASPPINIHNNPVHHRFYEHPVEHTWSSFVTCVLVKPAKHNRDKVIVWFDNQTNFKFVHNQKIEIESIENWLEI